MSNRQRRTKILATLGPATDPPGVLDALFRAGVDVVRLNFSHGDPSSQARRAAEVRAAAQRVGVEIGILADLPGPKIRIDRFAEGKVALKAGDRFDLVASPDAPPRMVVVWGGPPSAASGRLPADVSGASPRTSSKPSGASGKAHAQKILPQYGSSN